MRRTLPFFLLLVAALPAGAQTGADPVAPGARRTVIDMDAEVIEGTLNTPDVPVVKARTGAQFRSLIQLRTDFRREVIASGSRV